MKSGEDRRRLASYMNRACGTPDGRLRGVDCLGRERGMSDRHSGAERAGRSIDLGIELLEKRLDDTGPEAGFTLGADAIRLADPVVGDRQLPVRSGHVIGDVDDDVLERMGASDMFSHAGYRCSKPEVPTRPCDYSRRTRTSGRSSPTSACLD